MSNYTRPNQIVSLSNNPIGILHIRLFEEYLTFCGRNSEDCKVVNMLFVKAIDNPNTCKSCLKAAFK